jgi:hypothetical protein
MKAIIASGLVTVVTFLTVDNCNGSRQENPPSFVQRTQVSDGVWVVGDEIKPGLWEPKSDWRKMPDCAWFVSPAPKPSRVPSKAPSPTPTSAPSYANPDQLVVRLHEKEAFTTVGCGVWEYRGK